MIENAFKLIFRDLKKKQLYAFIKIGGFSIGITACFLIAIFIRNELSYDKHYENSDKIFRVVQVQNINGKIVPSTVIQAPLAETLVNDYPEIENAGRIMYIRAGKSQIRRSDGDRNINESGVAFVEQSILDIFQPKVLEGNLKEALANVNSIVITKQIADKYFGNDAAVGKSLIINDDNENLLTITAVIDDFPDNSHMKFNFLVSLNLPDEVKQNWDLCSFHNYVLLKPGTDVAQLEEKMKSIFAKYIIPFDEEQNQFFYDRTNDHYELQNIKDIHLKSAHIFQNASFDFADVGDLKVMWVLGISAFLILLLACINSINLTIAKSVIRVKEIGLRKTLGAKKRMVAQQFFSESITYSAISILLALGLTVLLLPSLNQISEKQLTIPWNEFWLIPLLLTITLILGILAGIYPSYIFSSANIIKTLQGKISKQGESINLRSKLVIFQFVASMILISCTILISKQINFVLNKDLGFTKDQVLILHGCNSLGNSINSFKEELKSIAGIEKASVSSFLPIENSMRDGITFYKEGRRGIDPGITGQNWVVDNDYVETIGLKIIEGRDFSEDRSTDQNAVLINQKMAKQLNLVQPVGKRIFYNENMLTVIGVVENFHYDKMNYLIRPLAMRKGTSSEYISVKVSTTDMAAIIGSIKNLWDKTSPSQEFIYSFLDVDYAKMYSNVKQTGTIIKSFACLAIIVACLGLFGLSEFITKQRTKEIGVRKVNGANIIEILALLNKTFVKWVFFAFILSSPIAWYAMTKWLENFAYKTQISWWIFALAGAIALFIALITVSFQSYKAANRNPVEALRYE